MNRLNPRWDYEGGAIHVRGRLIGYYQKQDYKLENLQVQRLYEIDDHPGRRAWLDKLLAFMEDRGTPIKFCPTINKKPLDLYWLYMYTNDWGGFLECTNKKTWKDIGAQIGIGPSSSVACSLKKHYGKNLLPFECHFERAGIDPASISAQVEAQSKKKAMNNQNSSARAHFPGSQDSDDSFTGSYQDGYPGHGGCSSYNNYPPGDPLQGPSHYQGPTCLKQKHFRKVDGTDSLKSERDNNVLTSNCVSNSSKRLKSLVEESTTDNEIFYDIESKQHDDVQINTDHISGLFSTHSNNILVPECEPDWKEFQQIASKQIKCTLCDNIFPNIEDLKFHRLNVHQLTFACGVCHYQSATKDNLKLHILVIHKEVRFSCCKNTNNLEDHLAARHGGGEIYKVYKTFLATDAHLKDSNCSLLSINTREAHDMRIHPTRSNISKETPGDNDVVHDYIETEQHGDSNIKIINEDININAKLNKDTRMKAEEDSEGIACIGRVQRTNCNTKIRAVHEEKVNIISRPNDNVTVKMEPIVKVDIKCELEEDINKGENITMIIKEGRNYSDRVTLIESDIFEDTQIKMEPELNINKFNDDQPARDSSPLFSDFKCDQSFSNYEPETW